MLTSSHTMTVSVIGTSGFIGYRSIKHSLQVTIQMCTNYICYKSFLALFHRHRDFWLSVGLGK